MLDIVFEGRNKEYGAYLLRKQYPFRLYTALSGTGILIGAFLLLLYLTPGDLHQIRGVIVDTGDTRLIKDPKEPKPEPPPPPAKPAPPPAVARIRFTSPPLIIREKDVKPEDQPPVTGELENTQIGVETRDGLPEDPLMAPPAETFGIIEKPAKGSEDEDFRPVEIESTYPGGPEAWRRFLIRTLRYPVNAQENGIKGTVEIGFIVDSTGAVSQIQAVSGPGELQQEGLRVIQKSGKWTPAIQNGRKVRSYKKQSISFQLSE